ncbi:MAG: PaaI family thioesterase [Actinomycetota bacterium]|nr:PaaI family thioesterase [Acidimicrobiales bacterium]
MNVDEINEVPLPYEGDRQAFSVCFGCGAQNQQGLRLKFSQYLDGTIETKHSVAFHHCGLETVVHGGIQATILDEVMGVAAQTSIQSSSSDAACVTAEMHLTYRRPVPMSLEVVARAKVLEIEGRDIHVSGAIYGVDGAELTSAVSRWRQLRS